MTLKSVANTAVTQTQQGLGWALDKIGSTAIYRGENLRINRTSLWNQGGTVLLATISFIAFVNFQVMYMPVAASIAVTNGVAPLPVVTVVNMLFLYVHHKMRDICKKAFFSTVSHHDFTKLEWAKEASGCVLTAVGIWSKAAAEKCKVQKTAQPVLSDFSKRLLSFGVLTAEGLAMSLCAPISSPAVIEKSIFGIVGIVANMQRDILTVGQTYLGHIAACAVNETLSWMTNKR